MAAAWSLLRVVSVPVMLTSGALLTCQSQINSQLAEHLGGSIRAGAAASAISFGSGVLLLSILVGSSSKARSGLRDIRAALGSRRLRPLEVVGGLCGAFVVVCQTLIVGTIDVALFIVAFTAGQAVCALVFDYLGISPRGRQAITAPRAIAAALALVAVTLTAAERFSTDVGPVGILFTVAAACAGGLTALQQALNGRVSAVGGPLPTAWMNFVVGGSAVAVFLLASLVGPGRLDAAPSIWWLYVGGALGVTVIWIASWTVRIHGVLVLGVCTIAGQVLAAQILDVIQPDSRIGPFGLLGGALTVAGVVFAFLVRGEGGSTSRARR